MPYLRYLYVFVLSGVQQTLCCVFPLFVLCLVNHMFPVSLDCQFRLPLRYSLAFIYHQ